jgi:hypothetical protein
MSFDDEQVFAYIFEVDHGVVHFSLAVPSTLDHTAVGSTLCHRNYVWVGAPFAFPIGGASFFAFRVYSRPLTCIQCIAELVHLEEAVAEFEREPHHDG